MGDFAWFGVVGVRSRCVFLDLRAATIATPCDLFGECFFERIDRRKRRRDPVRAARLIQKVELCKAGALSPVFSVYIRRRVQSIARSGQSAGIPSSFSARAAGLLRILRSIKKKRQAVNGSGPRSCQCLIRTIWLPLTRFTTATNCLRGGSWVTLPGLG